MCHKYEVSSTRVNQAFLRMYGLTIFFADPIAIEDPADLMKREEDVSFPNDSVVGDLQLLQLDLKNLNCYEWRF